MHSLKVCNLHNNSTLKSTNPSIYFPTELLEEPPARKPFKSRELHHKPNDVETHIVGAEKWLRGKLRRARSPSIQGNQGISPAKVSYSDSQPLPTVIAKKTATGTIFHHFSECNFQPRLNVGWYNCFFCSAVSSLNLNQKPNHQKTATATLWEDINLDKIDGWLRGK